MEEKVSEGSVDGGRGLGIKELRVARGRDPESQRTFAPGSKTISLCVVSSPHPTVQLRVGVQWLKNVTD